jgi:DNA-binding response OmpR family regulator
MARPTPPRDPMRIVVLDTDSGRRATSCAALRADGHDVTAFDDGAALLEHLSRLFGPHGNEPDVIVTQERVGAFSALGASRRLREAGWHTAFVVIAPTAEGAARGTDGVAVLRPCADPADLRMTVLNVAV